MLGEHGRRGGRRRRVPARPGRGPGRPRGRRDLRLPAPGGLRGRGRLGLRRRDANSGDAARRGPVRRRAAGPRRVDLRRALDEIRRVDVVVGRRRRGLSVGVLVPGDGARRHDDARRLRRQDDGRGRLPVRRRRPSCRDGAGRAGGRGRGERARCCGSRGDGARGRGPGGEDRGAAGRGLRAGSHGAGAPGRRGRQRGGRRDDGGDDGDSGRRRRGRRRDVRCRRVVGRGRGRRRRGHVLDAPDGRGGEHFIKFRRPARGALHRSGHHGRRRGRIGGDAVERVKCGEPPAERDGGARREHRRHRRGVGLRRGAGREVARRREGARGARRAVRQGERDEF